MHHSISNEAHLSNRNHWLRAAVLDANDVLISTASLLVGVTVANPSSQTLLLLNIALKILLRLLCLNVLLKSTQQV